MASRKKPHNKNQIKNDYVPPYPQEVLILSVDSLKLREETKTLLKGAGIKCIRDLAVRTEKDFYRIHTFNKKNLLDVKNALKAKKVAIRPMPEEETKAETKPTATAVVEDNQGQTDKTKGKGQVKGRSNDKYGVDETFVMTTLPPKPPKPKKVVIKEEPDIYVKINRGGKWGFKDRNGKQVIEPVYDEVFKFQEDICCVEKEEKFGFINRQGEIIIPLDYDCAASFSEGYACVYKREKCGYINASNEEVTDFVFDAGTPVINGECRVKKDGKWGEMHLNKDASGRVTVSEIRWIT